jgi:3,4-dihydroxy 2-butanone 4-phosphate synthase/GTP cyclohydrolase II
LVTLSYAQSLDGSIAAQRGHPLVLSGPESMRIAHQLRAAHDSILVGIGTLLSDDPSLTVRLVNGQSPRAAILDSRLRTPLGAKVLHVGSPILFCTALASGAAEKTLVDIGASIERQSDNLTDQVDLPAMLARIKEMGFQRLMVEGGGQVITSFLRSGFVDRVVITIAPRFVGGYKAVNFDGVALPNLINVGMQQFGEDLVVWGELSAS